MTIGEKITALRNEYNLSQGALAEKMNVSRQSISKWETDKSVPDLDKLVLLSEIFHISIDELVKDEEPFSPSMENVPPNDTETQPMPKAETSCIDDRK